MSQEQILKIINELRAKHKAPPLKWSDTIYKVSQSHADKLMAENKFEHSKNRLYGENLFASWGQPKDKVAQLAINSWYDEVKQYNYEKATFVSGTGHFTCLVWANAKECGLGVSFDEKTKKAIVVYNCSPPANVFGQFKTNVLAP